MRSDRGSRLGARGSVLGLLFAAAAPSAHAATCEGLAALSLPNATITIAQSIPAGSFTTPFNQTLINLPAFCRVAATLKPSSDSNIKIEVWLPAFTKGVGAAGAVPDGAGAQARPPGDGRVTWNDKLLAVGNGGWAG